MQSLCLLFMLSGCPYLIFLFTIQLKSLKKTWLDPREIQLLFWPKHKQLLIIWDNSQYNLMAKIICGVGSAHNRAPLPAMYVYTTRLLSTIERRRESSKCLIISRSSKGQARPQILQKLCPFVFGRKPERFFASEFELWQPSAQRPLPCTPRPRTHPQSSSMQPRRDRAA